MSLGRVLIIVMGLFPFGFLLWAWSVTMLKPVYWRFPWAGDGVLVVDGGGELELMKLKGPQPALMAAPAVGISGVRAPAGWGSYPLEMFTTQPSVFQMRVPHWAIAGGYVAIFMVIHVRLGLRRKLPMARH